MDHNFVKFTRWCHGSPVHRYGLYALQWIVEVNGKPTPDLDAFVNVTKVYPLAPSPALFQYINEVKGHFDLGVGAFKIFHLWHTSVFACVPSDSLFIIISS